MHARSPSAKPLGRPKVNLHLAATSPFAARTLAMIGAVICLAGPPAAAEVIYVDWRATGANDGSSWEDAYTELWQAMFHAFVPHDPVREIWVASGRYKPTGALDSRHHSFEMRTGVAVYGGFTGDETCRDERDWIGNETVLTGDLFDNDTEPWRQRYVEGDTPVPAEVDDACQALVADFLYSATCADSWRWACSLAASVMCCGAVSGNICDNSFHVVNAYGVNQTAILDGFTITGGAANYYEGSLEHAHGGALLAVNGRPTIRNCTFLRNAGIYGGAVSLGGMTGVNSHPVFEGCRFVENRSTLNYASAIYAPSALVRIQDCEFHRNMSKVVDISGPTGDNNSVRGCRFADNDGTALLFRRTAPARVEECTFVGNRDSHYLVVVGPSSRVDRCLFEDNHGPTLLRATNIRVSNTIFRGHRGGILYSEGGNVDIENCLVEGTMRPDGHPTQPTTLFSTNRGTARLMNCAIVDNGAYGSVARFYADETQLQFQNTIWWGNGHGLVDAVYLVEGGLESSYCTIEGWDEQQGGVGNTGEDPLVVARGFLDDKGTPDDRSDDAWVPGDYRLQPGSPAIDGGGPWFDTQYLPDDILGRPRVLCGLVDRGPYESGAGDRTCDLQIDLEDLHHWPSCETGPAGSVPLADRGGPTGGASYQPACLPFDVDHSMTIDLRDFAAWQNAFLDFL